MFYKFEPGTPGIGQKSQRHLGRTAIRSVELQAIRLQGLAKLFEAFYFKADMIKHAPPGSNNRAIGGTKQQHGSGQVYSFDFSERLACPAKIREVPRLHAVNVRGEKVDLVVFGHGRYIRASEQFDAKIVCHSSLRWITVRTNSAFDCS